MFTPYPAKNEKIDRQCLSLRRKNAHEATNRYLVLASSKVALCAACHELPTHLRARFREVGASLLVSTHYWVLTGMSTMPPSGRSKKLVPEFLEGIIHDQNVRQQLLSSPRLRMGNFAATVKSESEKAQRTHPNKLAGRFSLFTCLSIGSSRDSSTARCAQALTCSMIARFCEHAKALQGKVRALCGLNCINVQ